MLNRAYRSIPLIPAFSGMFILIVGFSQRAWEGGSLNLNFVAMAAILGIVCAYSTTIYVDDIRG